MKYIIFETPSGLDIPIVFPSMLGHAETSLNFPHYKVIGAGECIINAEGKFSVYGTSISLGYTSKKEDGDSLNKMLEY